MTPQEMIDVITAFRDGKSVETNDGGPDWWPVLSPRFNFHHFNYRVKPPALRPHYPILLLLPDGRHTISREVFPEDGSAKHDRIIGFVRLATEYPPVMLP